MDALKGVESERLKQHQTLYKTKTPPWKDAFRESCIRRLRNSRSRLVDKFRGLDLETDMTVDAVMKEEWESFSSRRGDIHMYKADSEDVGDAEVNQYISIMEEIQQELIEEEKKILEEYFAELEVENINSTVDWLEKNEVICPFCKKYALHQNLSVIFCGCGFRIDTQQDGFTLDNFKEQLHEGLDAHEKVCCSPPNFSILQYCSYTNLAITCEACNYMYLVI